jgi:high affinity sulfate transporter 1
MTTARVDLSSARAQPRSETGPLPAWSWLRRYTPGELRADAIAGLTLAAYLLPSAIGDASLAGLPPEAGLYACMYAGFVFWAFCSSRRTAISVTSAISLLMGTTLGAMAGGDATRFGALSACAALMVAGLAFLAWLLRAGSLVNFVSESVLLGFKAGVAFTLASTQVPKLLGIAGAHGGFSGTARHIGETNPASLAIGGAALAVLVLGRLLLKNKPVALLVVLGGIVASQASGLGAHGVKMLGDIPAGAPPFGVPAVTREDINNLLPLAMACFLLGAVETTAIGRMFASKHGDRLHANQELLALAGANLAAGLGHGFPVSGGMSQSLVNESAGARTPISGLVASGLILVVAVYFSGMLADLPQPVLAAIVLMAVVGLVNVRALVHLWRSDRQEFLIAGAAFAGVLASGMLRGVLIGAAISLLLLIRRASRPHVAILGRIPGTRRYSDIERHPDNEAPPGVLVFRAEASIIYFNAEHVRDCVLARLRAGTLPRTVLCDLSASPHVDIAGAAMLKELAAQLHAMGVQLRVVEARASVRDRLRAEGVEALVGPVDRFTSLEDAVECCAHPGVDGNRPDDHPSPQGRPVNNPDQGDAVS